MYKHIHRQFTNIFQIKKLSMETQRNILVNWSVMWYLLNFML